MVFSGKSDEVPVNKGYAMKISTCAKATNPRAILTSSEIHFPGTDLFAMLFIWCNRSSERFDASRMVSIASDPFVVKCLAITS